MIRNFTLRTHHKVSVVPMGTWAMGVLWPVVFHPQPCIPLIIFWMIRQSNNDPARLPAKPHIRAPCPHLNIVHYCCPLYWYMSVWRLEKIRLFLLPVTLPGLEKSPSPDWLILFNSSKQTKDRAISPRAWTVTSFSYSTWFHLNVTLLMQ